MKDRINLTMEKLESEGFLVKASGEERLKA